MTKQNGTTTETIATLARRLFLVVFFVFGLGESPFSGENAGVRSVLEAERALAFAAGATPLPKQFVAEAERGDNAKKGIGGGEDLRSAVHDARPARTPLPASGILPQRRPAPAPSQGFSSRAPPAFA